MRIGDLRRRLSLQKQVFTTGSAGQPTSDWVTIASIWGEIEPLTTQQRVIAAQTHVDVSHTITVRYRSEFQVEKDVVNMRILYGSRIFSINGAVNISERNRQVELLANEGLNDG